MEGFVNVKGTVEPSALAGSIAAEAHGRVAEAIALALDGREFKIRVLEANGA